MADDFLRPLAMWALAHEMADDAWKGAVARGSEDGADAMDALAALVSAEKDRLREALESGGPSGWPHGAPPEALEELRFEVGEVRGRLEAIETALDSISRRLDRA